MANEITQENNRRIKAQKKDVELFGLRLEKFLNQNLRRLLKGIDAESAIRAAERLGGLEAALREAGLEDVFLNLGDIYGDQLKALTATMVGASGMQQIASEIDFDVAEQLINFDVEAIKTRTYASVDELRSQVMRAVIIGDVDPVQIIEDQNGRLISRFDTELNTAISGFNGAITKQLADDLGLELFVYAGILIDTSRQFCIENVDQVFTREEIDQLDNEQGLDVWIYKGGYNCQHQWIPISLERAQSEYGYKG